MLKHKISFLFNCVLLATFIFVAEICPSCNTHNSHGNMAIEKHDSNTNHMAKDHKGFCIELCLSVFFTSLLFALTFALPKKQNRFYYQNKKLNYLKFNPLRPPIFNT